MKTTTSRSHIRIMSACDHTPGRCGICGEVVTIKFRDISTGALIGPCCVEATIAAERVLASPGNGDMRAPSITEAMLKRNDH